MRKLFATIAALVLASSFSACRRSAVPQLYPPIEPYRSGYLRVSDLHELYWELVGNPQGIPLIVLQASPGGSASPVLRRLFDPERFNILLFDQRGGMRSRPRGEWRENTTRDLVEDIDRVREHVGIEAPAILYGSSWGSTLALAYAEQHPQLVGGLILQGIFLGTKEEIDYLYHGGAAMFFPDTWEALKRVVPQPEVADYPRQLFEMVTGDDANERETAIEGWSLYELRLSSVEMTEAKAEEAMRENEEQRIPVAVLENYYMMNDCFLAKDQLLSQVERIADIPTYIVQGRLDMIYPPNAAWRLAGRLHDVELDLTDAAGHSQLETANLDAVMQGSDWVADRFRVEVSEQ